MAIPKYDEMYLACLQALLDDQLHKKGEIRDRIAAELGISEEERREMLSSGKQPVYNSRVNWTCAYLKQAGLIEGIARGVYRITDVGKKVMAQNPEKIDNKFLMQFESFREFMKASTKKPENGAPKERPAEENETPQDLLEDAYTRINAALAEEVLTEIMNQSPIFFEHLVVRLLTEMGYGGSLAEAATVTRASGDEGIDGIIREDKLGFSSIYVQAKRWERTATVGRPELQKFMGALVGQGASKGLFITTAQFTKEARSYIEKPLGAKIVLIDGPALAKLMIEYNVGVSTETTYAIKKIDSDFFDDANI